MLESPRTVLKGALRLWPIRRYVYGTNQSLCPRCGHAEPTAVIATYVPDENVLGLPITRLSRCECCGAVIVEEIPASSLAH
jgi:hypothetical protein